MLYHIEENVICSLCATKNFYETIWRDGEQIIRCRACGHERVISKITTNNNGTVWVLDKPVEIRI